MSAFSYDLCLWVIDCIPVLLQTWSLHSNQGKTDNVKISPGVFIATLRMSGIFDKTGEIPMNGEKICLEMCTGQ